jgi:Putative zinc-finger
VCHLFEAPVSNEKQVSSWKHSDTGALKTEPELNLETGHCLAKKPIEIDCEEVWRQISNYLDDEVDSGLRAIMVAHFKDCAHCSAILNGTRNVVKLAGDGRAFEIPAKASQRLYKKLNAHLATRRKA